MIDLHCHILPGVDDGVKTEQDAIEMARVAAAEGITHIVATPHHRAHGFDNPKEAVKTLVDILNQLFKEEQVTVTVLPGQEARVYGEMIEGLEAGELLTMNDTGRYLFVEFPTNSVPRYTERLFFDLQMKGVIPVIVHPERNQEIYDNPNALYHLVKDGALSQVTAASLTGGFGNRIKKLSFDLIEHNLAHFIASDAHNTTTRAFHLREAYGEIERQFGTDRQFYFLENAELLIDGQNVYCDEPQPIKEKKFLGLF